MAIRGIWIGDSTTEYTPNDMKNNFNKSYTGKVIHKESSLKVSAKTIPDLSVNVSAGDCSINGGILNNTSTFNLSIESNTANYPRIDAVVAYISGSIFDLRILKGTPAASPTAPNCSASTYIKLAEVYVGAGQTSIQSNNITDCRSSNNQFIFNSLNEEIISLKNRLDEIENTKSTFRQYTGSGNVVKTTILTDKVMQTKKQKIQMTFTAQEVQAAYQNFDAGTNNYNGAYWVPVYDAITPNKVLDISINIINGNKWSLLNFGKSPKYGQPFSGGINSNGIYVFIPNLQPNKNDNIGLEFIVTIEEDIR